MIGHKFTISVTMDVSPFAWCLARAVLNSLLNIDTIGSWSISYIQADLAKLKGLLIKIKVIKGFSATLKVLKDCNQIKGFLKVLLGRLLDISTSKYQKTPFNILCAVIILIIC